MATEREFYERGDFTAAELKTRAPGHVTTAPEDHDPRSLRGEDLPPDTEGWD